MFICILEAANDSYDMVIHHVPALEKSFGLVRLETYNDCSCLCGQSFDTGLETIPLPGILNHELTIFVSDENILMNNGEACHASAVFGNTSYNNIIKCASQVMYEITKHDSDRRIGLLDNVESIPDLVFGIGQTLF